MNVDLVSFIRDVRVLCKPRLVLSRINGPNVVPNSNPLGIKRFVSSISISFKCECSIIMQMQHTKNLDPERFELGATLS